MEQESPPAPRRRPSLVEDLGIVGAASARRDPLIWFVGGALLLSTLWWASAPVAVGWCLVAALIVAPPRVARRFPVRAGPVVALVVVLAAAIAGLPHDRGGSLLAYDAMAALGQAMAVPWAASVARARWAGVSKSDADAASARLSIWVQEHPWRVASAVLALVGPCGALWFHAWCRIEYALTVDSARVLMMPQWLSPGALLLVASPFGRRWLRAAEVGVVALVAAGAVFATVHWIALTSVGAGNSFLGDLHYLLGIGGASLLLLVAAAWMTTLRLGWAARPVGAAVVLSLWLLVECWLASCVAERAEEYLPFESIDEWAVVVLRHGILLALFVAAVRSGLRGRTILVLAMLYGAGVTLLAARVAARWEQGLWYAPVAALGCLNQALFALAARRILSMSVVPPDHVLRADWAVDLRDVPARGAVHRG